MPVRQKVYFPPRLLLSIKIAGNPILQLEHAGGIEETSIREYNKRGVKGWTLGRPNGEQVLAVAKKTTANPYGSLLFIPSMELPRSQGQVTDGYRWITPRPKTTNENVDLLTLCSQVCESWKGAFQFLEETSDSSEVIPGLRQPQMGALYASLAHWKVTDEVGTIVMPTGTGKTETMLAILVKERIEKLLVIVPTSALRDQIADKFLTFGVLQQFGIVGKDAGLPIVGKVKHRFESAEDASLFLQSCNVTVATMAVIGGCSDEIQNALAVSCSHLFIDEAHHVPAQTWNAFRELVCEQKKPILQFTATPFRRDGKHVGGKSIFTYPLWKAQKEEYFTPITFISIWEYNRNLADVVIAKRAIQSLREDLSTGHDHLLMARTDNIERAKQVHEIYKDLAADLTPLIVHSQQQVKEQLAAIESLRSRDSRIIVCVDMLGEGFDLPQLKIAALHDIHKSLAVTIQFVGRFTRSALGIGEATVIANAADADVEQALEDLYAKDSDWNIVLRRLSEGETSRQRKRSEFMEGFQNAPLGIPLQNVFPKMSTVVYKTTCNEWDFHAVKELLENTELLVEPTVNPTEHVLLYITREQMPIVWGETKTVQDLVHNLYLAYWNEQQKLLFINSTNNKSVHSSLAKKLAGDDVELIRGEKIYRCLYGVKRLILSNLGLLHLLSRATQFTLHVGSDIREGLSRASVSNRKKSNLFSRGYEDGRSVTIGASHKGRIWSHRIAEDISEWVDWCQSVGTKLLDDSISTEKILEHVIIPEEITERPNLVPLIIEWPPYFLQRSDEAVQVEVGDKSTPFYQADLKITTFNDTGPIHFCIIVDDVAAEYELIFNTNEVKYLPTSEAIAYLSASGFRKTLTEWFQEESPIITFEDTSKLEYNELFRPKTDREPYDVSKIEHLDWTGIVLTKESQYKAQKHPPRLELRSDSIQRHMIERLLGGYKEDYDIIFDDDGAGEIADIVALRVAGDNLLVHLFHCKYSKSSSIGARVGDFYEVCGQAQKSVYWRNEVKHLFERLKLREMQRQNTFAISRFEKGDLQKLDELRRRSRVLYPKFHIYVVQPGLGSGNVDGAVLDLLGATELYLRETFDVPFTVIVSA